MTEALRAAGMPSPSFAPSIIDEACGPPVIVYPELAKSRPNALSWRMV